VKENLKAEAQRFKLLHFERPENNRYNESSNVERVNPTTQLIRLLT